MPQHSTIDLNQNTAACIQSWSDFGVSHYKNICTGVVSDVPWGAFDWFLGTIGVAFGVALIGGAALMFFGMAIEMWRGW